MAEQQPRGPERAEAFKPRVETVESAPKQVEKRESSPEAPTPDIDKLEHEIKQQAVSVEDMTGAERESAPAPQAQYGSLKQLKAESYRRTLTRIQSRLSAPDRVFSSIIHHPVVESVSNVAAKTAARPSGILGGGFFALVGSGVLLYLARSYGFVYNYFAFIALFIIGFAIGLLLEGLVRLVRVRRR